MTSIRHRVLSLLVAAIAPLLIAQASQAQLAPADSAGYPDQIHLSWIDDPSTTIAVTWRTGGESGSPRGVSWRRMGQDIAEVVTPARTDAAPGGRGWLHKTEITGLDPDSFYEYRLAGGGELSSEKRAFRTAPASMPPGGVTFTINGDMGTSFMGSDVRPVLERLAAEPAGLHIIAGDLTYADEIGGTEYEEYWFAMDLPIVATDRPVMVAWGNHEYYRDYDVGIETITRYFQMPRNGVPNTCNPFPFYGFRYAGIHFVVLDDPESPCFDRETQRTWLEAELTQAAADPTVKWKVAVMHQPPFSSSCHGSQPVNRHPEFDRFGVDLVLAAHDHNYERTLPVSWDGSQIGAYESNPRLPVYLVAGTGGSRAYDCVTPNAWSAFHDPGLHFGYVRVTAAEAELVAEFVGKEAYVQNAGFEGRDNVRLAR